MVYFAAYTGSLVELHGTSKLIPQAARAAIEGLMRTRTFNAFGFFFFMSHRFSSTIFPATARLALEMRTPSDGLLNLCRQVALKPEIFDSAPPFFFAFEASNSSLDAYFTRMAASSLRNYARDAAAGVSICDSHRTRELGIGQSLTGQYVEDGELARVIVEAFTVPGLPDTDAVIHKLSAGIARDVSIGFGDADFVCSVCSLDLWSWDCPHIPGVTYTVQRRNDKGEVIAEEEAVAFAWVENATLREVSIVYDGATPGCGILKAAQEVEAGRVTPAIATRFAAAYRGLAIPGYRQTWPGFTEKEFRMDPKTTLPGSAVPVAPAPLAQSLAPADPRSTPQLSNADQPEGVAIERVREALTAAEITAEDVLTGLRQMADLARDGRQYRADLITSALAEGTRAMGNDFSVETWRCMLERASLSEIKTIAGQWRAQADMVLPNGRKSADDAGEQSAPVTAAPFDKTVLVPPDAFGG